MEKIKEIYKAVVGGFAGAATAYLNSVGFDLELSGSVAAQSLVTAAAVGFLVWAVPNKTPKTIPVGIEEV